MLVFFEFYLLIATNLLHMKAIHRIREIIDHYRLSVSAFEKSITMSNNSIQIALKREASVKDEVLNKILKAYPDIDPVWLLTGEGTMFKEKEKQEQQAKESETVDQFIERKIDAAVVEKMEEVNNQWKDFFENFRAFHEQLQKIHFNEDTMKKLAQFAQMLGEAALQYKEEENEETEKPKQLKK